jgi:hypothetical protein
MPAEPRRLPGQPKSSRAVTEEARHQVRNKFDVVGCIHQDAAYSVWGGVAVSSSADAHETLTFVVRLWREPGPAATAGHTRWRGRIEHVTSQQVGYVEDAAGVAHFIERWTKPGEEEMPMHQSDLS